MNYSTEINSLDYLHKKLEALRPIDTEVMGKVNQKLKLLYNYHSNSLEGNSLTLQETYTLLVNSYTPRESKPLQDVDEMRGHIETVDALGLLEGVVKDERDITETLIRDLNRMILVRNHKKKRYDEEGEVLWVDIIVGEYKTKPNHVLTATGEKFRFAEPGEATKAVMNDLLKWYEIANKGELHPLELAAMFHYKFIRIHPFDDGNGRVARLLMNLILQNKRYPIAVIPSENQAKERYYQALRTVDANLIELHRAIKEQNTSPFQPFIDYIAKQVQATTEMIINAAEGKEIFTTDDVLKQLELSLKSPEVIVENPLKVLDQYFFVLNTVDKICSIVAKDRFTSLEVFSSQLRYLISGKVYTDKLFEPQSRIQPDIITYKWDIEAVKQRINDKINTHAENNEVVLNKLIHHVKVLDFTIIFRLSKMISRNASDIEVKLIISQDKFIICATDSSRNALLIEDERILLEYQSPDWVKKLSEALLESSI